MDTVTAEWLAKHDACSDAQHEFALRYPDGEAPLHAVVAALATHPEGRGWFDWLLGRHQGLWQFAAAYNKGYLAAWKSRWATRRTAQDAWVAFEDAVRVAIRDIAQQLAEQAAAQGKE